MSEKRRTICIYCHESKPSGRYDTSDYCSGICEIAQLRTELAEADKEIKRVTKLANLGAKGAKKATDDFLESCREKRQLQTDLTAKDKELAQNKFLIEHGTAALITAKDKYIDTLEFDKVCFNRKKITQDKRIASLEGVLEKCKKDMCDSGLLTEEQYKKWLVSIGKVVKDTHTFLCLPNSLTYRCSKCGWTFEVPANHHQMRVILSKRRKYDCPLTEEMKQEYGFVTTPETIAEQVLKGE